MLQVISIATKMESKSILPSEISIYLLFSLWDNIVSKRTSASYLVKCQSAPYSLILNFNLNILFIDFSFRSYPNLNQHTHTKFKNKKWEFRKIGINLTDSEFNISQEREWKPNPNLPSSPSFNGETMALHLSIYSLCLPLFLFCISSLPIYLVWFPFSFYIFPSSTRF